MRDAIDTVRQFSRRVYHSYCFYCGVQLAHKKLSRFSRKPGTPHSSLANEFWWDTATFDHWIPKSTGGGHKHKVPCCLRCNRQKVALDVEDWRVVFFGAHVGKVAEMICTWEARWFTPKGWRAGLPHHTPLCSWWLTRLFFRLVRREYCGAACLVWSEPRCQPRSEAEL
jgi:hypothetical protein